MNKITFFVFLLFLVGCESESKDQSELNDISNEIKELTEELKNSNDNLRKSFDLNGDGTPDVTVEAEGNFYYELTDSNFDGKVNESWKYSEDDILVDGRIDQDHNGILETKFFVKHGTFTKEFSDSNENQIFDIYTKYNYGVVEYSEKYYSPSVNGNKAKIGKVIYKFSYPNGPEILKETTLTEKEFEISRLKE